MAGLLALPSAPVAATASAGRPTMPGFDAGTVIESVRHNLRATAPGSFRVDDRLYRADIGPSGLALTARNDPKTFTGSPGFELETTSALGAPVDPGTWTTDGNTATRALGRGLTERVTAREGALEWDVILEHAVPGDVRIDARVAAAGGPTRVRRGVRWPIGDRRSVKMGELVVVDATGTELHRGVPDAAARGVRLDVPGAKLARAVYPVTIDPVISVEYPVGDPVYVSSPEDDEEPAVAWSPGASEYLVVWSSETDSEDGAIGVILGARVTSAGVVLDKYGIEIAADTSSWDRPAVAFDGTNFLVFWSGPSPSDAATTDIFGIRVSTAGALVGSAFAVSDRPGDEYEPSVAWNGTHALVVWSDYDADDQAWGSLVHAPNVGAEFRLDDSGLYQAGSSPSVAWNGTRFLVAFWSYTSYPAPSQAIRARFVSAAGVPSGGFDVSTGDGSRYGADVASDGSGFLVAWANSDDDLIQYEIHAMRVDSAGTLLDGLPADGGLKLTTGGARDPAVAWNGTDYFVAWGDERSEYDIYGRRVTPAGALLAEQHVSGADGDQSAPDVVSNGSTFFAVWQDDRIRSNYDIYGSRLSATGAPLDAAGIAISTAASGQYDPSVAYDGTNYLVAWSDDRNGDDYDVYAARATSTGTILDPAGIAIATGSSDEGDPKVAWSGTSYIVTWSEAGGEGGGDVYARPVSSAGVPGSASLVESDAYDPAVAWNSSYFLVVYHNSFDGNIAARRYTGAGVADGGPFAITAADSDEEYDPAIASSGSTSLVTWSSYAGDYTEDVLGVIVDPLGAAQSPGEFDVSAQPDAGADQPSVAWSGSEYLVAWRDARNDGEGDSGDDIYAARVSQAGELVGSALQVSGAAFDQRRPVVAWNGWEFVVGWEDDRWDTHAEVYAARVRREPFALADPSGIELSPARADAYNVAVVAGPFARVAFVYSREAGVPYNSDRVFLRFFDDDPPDTTIVTGPSGVVASTSATFTFTASIAGSSFECALDAGGFTSCFSPRTYDGLTQGSHTFRVRSVDPAGTADTTPAERTWTADLGPPDTIITDGPPDPSNSQSATFKFVADESGSTFQCKLDGGAYAGCASPKTYTGLGEGPHAFYVRATDAYGFVDASPAAYAWKIDLTPPTTTITSGPPAVSASPEATFEFVSTEEGSTFRCTLDGGPAVDCAPPFTVTGLSQGSHSMWVQAVDPATNLDPIGDTHPWRIDGTGPDVDITRPSGSIYAFDVSYLDIGLIPIATGRTITVEATATEEVPGDVESFRFEVDGAEVPDSEIIHDGTTHRFVFRPDSTDVYTVAAIAKNRAGTESSDTQQLLFVHDGIPSDVRFRTTMSASAASVTPGSTYTYTVTVTNEGTEEALQTTIAVHLPVFTTLAPWDRCPPMPPPGPGGGGAACINANDFPTPGSSPGNADDPIHEQLFVLGPLLPGASTSVNFNVRVEDGTPTTTLRTHAHAFAPGQDSTTSNVVEVGVVGGAPAASFGARGSGAGEPGEPQCGYAIDIRQAPVYYRSTPQGERGAGSGTVHSLERPAGPAGPSVHSANCAALVTAGH